MSELMATHGFLLQISHWQQHLKMMIGIVKKSDLPKTGIHMLQSEQVDFADDAEKPKGHASGRTRDGSD